MAAIRRRGISPKALPLLAAAIAASIGFAASKAAPLIVAAVSPNASLSADTSTASDLSAR